MKWSLAWLAIATLLSGCSQPAANRFDPFSIYGPRTIPPPATGTLGQPPGGYYQGPTTRTTPAPAGASQQLLPVPTLGSQSRTSPSESSRAPGNWVPIHDVLADVPVPTPRKSQVVQAGGSTKLSDSLPWRIPDSVRSHVQPAGAIESIGAPYRPQPPGALSPQGVTEITELPRPIQPQRNGIPSAAVFPTLPFPGAVNPVIYYDQPVYDYGAVAPAVAYDGIAVANGYTYPAMLPANQPMTYIDQPVRSDGVVSTSVRSDAWKQRR